MIIIIAIAIIISKLYTTQWRFDGVMGDKSKLQLRIMLLINNMMKENLFAHAECSFVKHVAPGSSVIKNVTKEKKRKRVTP